MAIYAKKGAYRLRTLISGEPRLPVTKHGIGAMLENYGKMAGKSFVFGSANSQRMKTREATPRRLQARILADR